MSNTYVVQIEQTANFYVSLGLGTINQENKKSISPYFMALVQNMSDHPSNARKKRTHAKKEIKYPQLESTTQEN